MPLAFAISAVCAPAPISHGFFLLAVVLVVSLPASTVSGISLIPGIGLPVVMRSTISANVVGYGALGSEVVAESAE